MLKIRLQRTGRIHEPTFRLVLTDSKNGPKSGRYLENLGWFDARSDNKASQFDIARVKHWLSKGAQPSLTVHNFLITEKVISGKKRNALPKKTPIKKEISPEEAAAQAAPAATESASAATESAPAAEASAPASPEPAPAPEVSTPAPTQETPSTEPAPENK